MTDQPETNSAEALPPIIIEWPPRRPGVTGLQGWATAIYDAITGEQMMNIHDLTLVHPSVDDVIYADAQIVLFDSEPPKTEARRFVVAEMRIAPPAEHLQMPAGPSA